MKVLREKDGVALIMVLWITVILSFLLISLTEDIQLESFLTRNLLEETQIQQIAHGGIARALAELTADDTIYDGPQESWLEPIKGDLFGKGTFEVTIEDIGSRFNINYANENILLELMPEFRDDFQLWRLDQLPFYLPQELEALPGLSYETIEDQISFYGKFNLNTDDYLVLKEIMRSKRIADWLADQLIQQLEEVEENITSLDDLLIQIPALDLATLSMIRDDVTVSGNININLVEEEVMATLLDSYKLPRDIFYTIKDMREQEPIQDLRGVTRVLGEEYAQLLIPYFDVTSRYFLLTCTAKSATTSMEKTIKVEVVREPERIARGQVMEWRTEILSWVESE